MTGTVLVDRDGPVARLTISNPGARNALTMRMYDELEQACREFAFDASLRVVVISGAGGAFASGTDIHDLARIRSGESGVAYEQHIARVLAAMTDLRVPLVAVVDGPAVGGGLVIAALCDLVYCTPSAVFGSPIARTLGNTLAPTSMARLHATFGRRLTNAMLFTGRLIDARTAEAAGFANAVAEPEQLEEHVSRVVSDIVRSAPLSLRSFKEFERRIDERLMELDADDYYRACYASDDFRTGVASFLAKRSPPDFSGTA